ncbi:MAG: MarR family winged helix-turn-helix transcriptional regulator [Candidatus Limnocylindrales bacterium]|jgi:DNA-binding MarR family transcriptional regulator
MSEVSPRRQDVETLLESLGALVDRGGHDVPGWVAQDLTFGQMRLLFLLSKHGPSPVSHVAEWLGVGLPAASGVVERVERHGLVTRQHRQDDRRVVECALTDQGRQLIEEIGGMRREMLRQTIEVLSDEELADFTRIIATILERVRTRIE